MHPPAVWEPDFDAYFWKLHFSIKHLATGKGTLKKRLNEVFIFHLLHLLVEPGRSEIERLISESVQLATREDDPYGKLGKLHYTLIKSHWRIDTKIAENIFEAYGLATKAFYEKSIAAARTRPRS
jgi:hypothetical protein